MLFQAHFFKITISQPGAKLYAIELRKRSGGIKKTGKFELL